MTTTARRPIKKREPITPVQAAWLAELPTKAINAAIDKGELSAVRKATTRRQARRLEIADVFYLILRKNLASLLSQTAKRELYERLVAANLTDWSQQQVRSEFGSDCVISLGNGVVRIQVKSACQQLVKRWEALRLAEQVVISDPSIRGGEPVIRGTRVPVFLIADLMEQGADIKEILEDYPSLNADKLRSALAYVRTHPRRGRPKKAPWKEQRVEQTAR